MATGTTVSIIPCGAMTADLTWLLLAPGRAIRRRQDKDLPAEWVDVPTHCVLVDTPDGKLLWDTSCRGTGAALGSHRAADFFPTTRSPTTSTWTPGSSSLAWPRATSTTWCCPTCTSTTRATP